MLIASLLVGQCICTFHNHDGNGGGESQLAVTKHEAVRPHVHVGGIHTHGRGKAHSHSHSRSSNVSPSKDPRLNRHELGYIASEGTNHDLDAIYLLNLGSTFSRFSRTVSSSAPKVVIGVSIPIEISFALTSFQSSYGSRPPPIVRHACPIYLLNLSIRC